MYSLYENLKHINRLSVQERSQKIVDAMDQSKISAMCLSLRNQAKKTTQWSVPRLAEKFELSEEDLYHYFDLQGFHISGDYIIL